MIEKLRKYTIILWILSVVAVAIYVSQHRDLLKPENLLVFFQSFGTIGLILYFFSSILRGIVLLPSLPLVLVGTLFFPDNPHIVFVISMIGIVFSAIVIYEFSEIMGFDRWFSRHEKNEQVLRAIERYGFPVIALWSFIPIVPTDVICYVAGMVRYSFWKFILAVSLGEAVIVGIIVYGGKELMSRVGL